MDQRIIKLYDEYTHKPLKRDDFIKKLAILTGSTMAAMAIIPLLENNSLKAQVLPQDETLQTEYITYTVAEGKMRAYQAQPKAAGKYPGVIVIHENRGLNAHIEDVARRAASAGYIAIAVDALSLLGGTPTNQDEARGMFGKLDAAKSTENFAAGIGYLQGLKNCTGKVGCVGFCWGGGMANDLSMVKGMLAAVAFYGRPLATEKVPNITGAVQLHYGSLDERINAGAPAFETALKANKKPYEMYYYEGVNHAFHNDTSEARYDKAAATLAWERTIAFFKKYLS